MAKLSAKDKRMIQIFDMIEKLVSSDLADGKLRLTGTNRRFKNGSMFFNDLLLRNCKKNRARHYIVSGELSRYFQVGVSYNKKVCYIGVSQFFLDVMGFSRMGLAYANKDFSNDYLVINFVLKRQKNDVVVFANQRLALQVYDEALKKAIVEADLVAMVATVYDGKFSNGDEYFPPSQFYDLNSRKAIAEINKKDKYKRTNF